VQKPWNCRQLVSLQSNYVNSPCAFHLVVSEAWFLRGSVRLVEGGQAWHRTAPGHLGWGMDIKLVIPTTLKKPSQLQGRQETLFVNMVKLHLSELVIK